MMDGDLQDSLCHWPDHDFKIWMDSNMGSHGADFVQANWGRYLACWRVELPHEKAEVVEAFLKQWIKQGCGNERAKVTWGTDAWQIKNAVFEPMTMALATPEDPWHPVWLDYPDPPSQRAIEKRLATWLQNVILHKDSESLDVLAEALRRIQGSLWIGISVDEVIDKLEMDHSDYWSREKILNDFRDFIAKEGKLPNKQQITAHVTDASNRSRYLKMLGLAGLPRAPRTPPNLVVRKTQ